MKVVLSSAAKADLVSIGDYIAKDSPGRAATFVRKMRTAVVRLGTMPEAFPLVPRYAHRGIRRYPYRDDSIFYRTEADHIAIIRILHGARDYEALLFPGC